MLRRAVRPGRGGHDDWMLENTVMPNITSAKKRVRQTVKRTARNRARKEKLKKAVRSFRAAVATGEGEAIQKALPQVTRIIDKMGTKGLLPKNAVNRRKSRAAKAANKALAAKA